MSNRFLHYHQTRLDDYWLQGHDSSCQLNRMRHQRDGVLFCCSNIEELNKTAHWHCRRLGNNRNCFTLETWTDWLVTTHLNRNSEGKTTLARGFSNNYSQCVELGLGGYNKIEPHIHKAEWKEKERETIDLRRIQWSSWSWTDSMMRWEIALGANSKSVDVLRWRIRDCLSWVEWSGVRWKWRLYCFHMTIITAMISVNTIGICRFEDDLGDGVKQRTTHSSNVMVYCLISLSINFTGSIDTLN